MSTYNCKVNVYPHHLWLVQLLAFAFSYESEGYVTLSQAQCNFKPRNGFNYTFKITRDRADLFENLVYELWLVDLADDKTKRR